MIHLKKTGLCGAALSAVLLGGAFTTVGVFSSQALASPAATKTTKSTFTLYCKTGLANGDVTVDTTQVYSPSVKAGSKFTLKWQSITHVSTALATAAYGIAAGGKEKGTVTLDNDLSSDAKPSTLNLAGKKGIPEEGYISSPSGFAVYTPSNAAGTALKGFNVTPSFTAGKKGKDTVRAQDDNATIDVYQKSGKKVTTVTADCTPVGPPKVIATINVT
jgi:hypothetical protein